jgi:hypothetical protein
LKAAGDLIPWKVTEVAVRPYEGMWSFNPSIHFDGSLWLCVLRCCDYAMPNGVTIRSEKARPAGNQTKNAMIVLDPDGWKPAKVFNMRERDDTPRVPCANIGYEDMRIFKTDRGGLQGIAASLHLARDTRPAAGGTSNQPPEQVLLSFDAEYNIVKARPIRGDWWSGSPQKNWVPFDDCVEPRFLYSIDKGTMFDARGAVSGQDAVARPSAQARPSREALPKEDEERARKEQEERASREHEAREREAREREDRERREREERARREQERKRAPEPSRDPRVKLTSRGTDVSMVRGRRSSIDAMASRPAATRRVTTRVNSENNRVLGTGRALPPRYPGLRGGTQLVRVGDDAWLGIGHEMKFLSNKKWYWHTWYVVDSRGKMKSVSEPMKLVPNGIEFAAGMAIDGDRVAVSFGVDDMECRIGETSLGAVMARLHPVDR